MGSVPTRAALLEGERRPLGLRLIIAYKALKVPVMLGLAIWLTFTPKEAHSFIGHLSEALAESGGFRGEIGRWLLAHVTAHLTNEAAVLCWLDTVVTGAEATLLYFDHPWGEWIVVLVLAALVPVELFAVHHHFSWVRVGVLCVNILTVAYLVRRRVRLRAFR